MNQKMITIIGPTASGKTSLAAHLAAALISKGTAAEILSGDSRQVYRGMDIGTGKDLADYNVSLPGTNTMVSVPYHLIDIAEPGTKYNLFRYQQDFQTAYDEILSRGALPILCGGTGLYIEAVLKGYALSPVPQNDALRAELEGKSLEELTVMLDELKAKNGTSMHNTTDVDTAQRAIRAIEIEKYNLDNPQPQRLLPQHDSLVVGVSIDREVRREKISYRLRQRLDGGMVDEIRKLIDQGVKAEDLIYYGLEYKYVTEFVIGKLSFDEMFRSLEIAIHQFAKRQMTWLRGMERRGTRIHWIDVGMPIETKIDTILKLYEQYGG